MDLYGRLRGGSCGCRPCCPLALAGVRHSCRRGGIVEHCPLCVSRRALMLGLVGLGVGAGRAFARAPEPVVEVLGRGRTDFAEAIGGPAELVAAKVTLPPGAVIPWHTHPG